MPLPIQKILAAFSAEFAPLEGEKLLLLRDKRTGAQYVECHVSASKLVALATKDVPLDPDGQPEYRANREIVGNHYAFRRMKEDASQGRTFSNIVAEYTKGFDPEHPLKIIGGQHRFEAIRLAFRSGVNEHHGVKVYLELDTTQRLDVQLISNANIMISKHLYDRMHETFSGPQLREWCQSVGLLEPNTDFADSSKRGGPITVQLARTFIVNYYLGTKIDAQSFRSVDTTPKLCKTGADDEEWERLKKDNPNIYDDSALLIAGVEFAELVNAQRQAFSGKKAKADFAEKAMSAAVIAAWAYVAGVLHKNQARLERHFDLKNTGSGRDPLNAAALAKGRHKTDSPQYRGLGYRSDSRELGRFVELFYLQAENGKGITTRSIEIAIKDYHARQALLDAQKARDRDKDDSD